MMGWNGEEGGILSDGHSAWAGLSDTFACEARDRIRDGYLCQMVNSPSRGVFHKLSSSIPNDIRILFILDQPALGPQHL